MRGSLDPKLDVLCRWESRLPHECPLLPVAIHQDVPLECNSGPAPTSPLQSPMESRAGVTEPKSPCGDYGSQSRPATLFRSHQLIAVPEHVPTPQSTGARQPALARRGARLGSRLVAAAARPPGSPRPRLHRSLAGACAHHTCSHSQAQACSRTARYACVQRLGPVPPHTPCLRTPGPSFPLPAGLEEPVRRPGALSPGSVKALPSVSRISGSGRAASTAEVPGDCGEQARTPASRFS